MEKNTSLKGSTNRPSVPENSGTGWGAMEAGALALQPGACVGSSIPRRYDVTELLGRGGMGEVHLAFDERVGRDVALKVLSDAGRSRRDIRASFLREARIQGVLDHPGIVPVHDVDRDESGQDFLVMKRVMGTTLEEVVRRLREGSAAHEDKFPLRRLLWAYLQACLTVDYAHSRGVVHRDLKPSNLMLGDYGEVYVLDWGIAHVAENEMLDRVVTQDGNPTESLATTTYLSGTPGYAAPEQPEDAHCVDARSDVYSLGVVLFTLLTLEPLHRGSSVKELLESTQRGADARPTVRAPLRGLPPEYDAICVRATAKDPAERYANVRELHDAVARVLDSDRDMRLRVELAAAHIMEAKQALAPGGLPHANLPEARRVALRHASRSLALHPQNQEAAALVRRLMLAPPEEVPPEVELETRDLAIREAVRQGRGARVVSLGLTMATAAILAWMGVRVWSAVALLVVPTGLIIAIGMSAKPPFTNARLRNLVAAVLVALSVAGTSRIAGPLWFPPLFVLLYAGIVSWNHGLGRWRLVCIAIALMGAAVPWWLDVTGVTASQYVFQHEGIFVREDMVAFPADRAPWSVAGASILLIALAVAASFRFSRADMQTRRRFQLIAWHLRGLASGTEDEPRHSSSASPNE